MTETNSTNFEMQLKMNESCFPFPFIPFGWLLDEKAERPPMGSVGCRQMNMAADVRPAWLPFQISQSRI